MNFSGRKEVWEKTTESGARYMSVQILAQILTGQVTTGRSLHLSESQIADF